MADVGMVPHESSSGRWSAVGVIADGQVYSSFKRAGNAFRTLRYGSWNCAEVPNGSRREGTESGLGA